MLKRTCIFCLSFFISVALIIILEWMPVIGWESKSIVKCTSTKSMNAKSSDVRYFDVVIFTDSKPTKTLFSFNLVEYCCGFDHSSITLRNLTKHVDYTWNNSLKIALMKDLYAYKHYPYHYYRNIQYIKKMPPR